MGVTSSCDLEIAGEGCGMWKRRGLAGTLGAIGKQRTLRNLKAWNGDRSRSSGRSTHKVNRNNGKKGSVPTHSGRRLINPMEYLPFEPWTGCQVQLGRAASSQNAGGAGGAASSLPRLSSAAWLLRSSDAPSHQGRLCYRDESISSAPRGKDPTGPRENESDAQHCLQ